MHQNYWRRSPIGAAKLLAKLYVQRGVAKSRVGSLSEELEAEEVKVWSRMNIFSKTKASMSVAKLTYNISSFSFALGRHWKGST